MFYDDVPYLGHSNNFNNSQYSYALHVAYPLWLVIDSGKSFSSSSAFGYNHAGGSYTIPIFDIEGARRGFYLNHLIHKNNNGRVS